MRGVKSSLGRFKLYNRQSKLQQAVVGTAAGVATGYLAFKVGRPIAFVVGGGIILFQVAQNHGLTRLNWNEARRRSKHLTQNIEERACCWKYRAKEFAQNNSSMAASFIGGFLIGAACVH